MEVCASGCSYDEYGKCHVYSSDDTYPEVTFWLRDKVTKEIVPRFDESMIIQGGGTSVIGGWMRLSVKSSNESNGTFVLQGSQDLTPGESTEVSFACSDYFGKYIGGAIWW